MNHHSDNAAQGELVQTFLPVAPFSATPSGFSVPGSGSEHVSGQIHRIAISQNAERDDSSQAADTNGVLDLDYFTAHNGAKKLAVTMIIHACTTLNMTDGENKVARLKAAEMSWLRGGEAIVSFKDCLEMLNLERFEERLADKIATSPRECLEHFRAMYCQFDQEVEVDQDDQGYRVGGMPRMVA